MCELFNQSNSAASAAPQAPCCESATDLMSDIINSHIGSDLAGLTLPDLMDSAKCRVVRNVLFSDMSVRFELENKIRGVGYKLKKPDDLPAWVVARIVLSTGAVRVLVDDAGHSDDDLSLAIKSYYANASTGNQPRWSGEWSVINPADSSGLAFKILRNLCPSAKRSDRADYLDALTDAPVAYLNKNPDIIHFRNGIWDCQSRQFTAYDDPNFDALYANEITLAKLPICFAGGPGSPIQVNADGSLPPLVIHNDADGTDWSPLDPFQAPFEMDTDIGQACNKILLQTAQFALRCYNGQFGFYQFWVNQNGRGQNGKGVLGDIIAGMLQRPRRAGDDDLSSVDRVAYCKVEEIGEPYSLAKSIRTAHMVLGEESKSGNGSSYISDTATFKLLCRQQPVQYRQIYKAPYDFAFHGPLVMQSNGVARTKEKSYSVISHVLAIPFVRCFTDDECREYIKADYVKREDVATWLAYYVTAVLPTYDEYDMDAVKLLEPYREEVLADSMNTAQFLDECLSVCPMDVLPVEFLYALYTRWAESHGYSGAQVVTMKAFRSDMQQYAIMHPEVMFSDKPQRVSVSDINNPNRAAYYWGRTSKQGWSDFIDYGQTDAFYKRESQQLKISAFVNPGSGTRRQFNRGCFVRASGHTIAELPWWDNVRHDYVDDAC